MQIPGLDNRRCSWLKSTRRHGDGSGGAPSGKRFKGASPWPTFCVLYHAVRGGLIAFKALVRLTGGHVTATAAEEEADLELIRNDMPSLRLIVNESPVTWQFDSCKPLDAPVELIPTDELNGRVAFWLSDCPEFATQVMQWKTADNLTLADTIGQNDLIVIRLLTAQCERVVQGRTQVFITPSAALEHFRVSPTKGIGAGRCWRRWNRSVNGEP